MNVFFCDLCNESIPQADLELGRAVRRNERLICAACEAAMSSGTARAAPAPAEAAPQHLVASHAPAAAPQSSSSVSAVALAFSSVALVAGVGASAYLFWRLEDEATRLEQQLADLERLAPQHALTVSANLKEEIGERESEAAQARSAIQALAARVQELEQTAANAAALERRIDKLDGRLASLDDFASRVERQIGVVDNLSLTVAELVAARARATEQAALDPAQPSQSGQSAQSGASAPLAPASANAIWQRWVPDLSSSDPGTRWQAVQALGETHDLAALPHLVPLLTDGDIFVRMATCRSLSNLGGIEAVPALIDTLEDEEAAVRDAALVALKGLTDQTIAFDPLARDADRSKRVKAWREWWEEASKELLGKGKTRSKS